MNKARVFLWFFACLVSLLFFVPTARAVTPTITGSVQTLTVSGQALLAPPSENAQEFIQKLKDQELGSPYTNPVKYAVRNAITSGVSVETITLLLLLPVIAVFVTAARHLVGLRGFGIFLPASLSVVFLATGPVVGIALFILIILISSLFRVGLRRLKLKLQYLPRMSLMLWAVSLSVLGVLFAAPYVPQFPLKEVSIFPVLILVLLTEEFTRVHLGKSIDVAVSLTSETLMLAILSFALLSYKSLQEAALLHPETVLLAAAVISIFLGRYTGLRLLEIWRFRKLLGK